MAPAGIVTQLDVDTTDVVRAFFIYRGLKLLDVQIAFERLVRGQIISRLVRGFDDLRAIHFDMHTGRWKQQISNYKSVGSDVNFGPDALRRSPLGRRDQIRKTENAAHFIGQ